MKASLVCDALRMATWQRNAEAGLIVHSDRGSQYASRDYRRLLKAHGFVGSLKQEQVQWRNYQDRHEAQQDVLEYITMFYNSRRLHSYLGHQSPNSHEA